MSHNKHTEDRSNIDLLDGKSKQYYLDLTKDWEDPFGTATLDYIDDKFYVVRDDLIAYGSKCRFGDLLVKHAMESGKKRIVYCQPRKGYAGISLSYLCEKYGIELVLFMPACKEISEHQMICIERGAIPKFHKIAAMPVLNSTAKKWAEANDGFFVPLGLKHELVTACAVRVCENIKEKFGEPKEFWTAFSTGVLSRALQISFPNTKFYTVAVSRNIHDGERGNIEKIYSHPLPFLRDEKPELRPPYPSCNNYDAKIWRFVQEHGSKDAWIWNVAGNDLPEDKKLHEKIDSQRAWNEHRY
jgi:hypothetical protein